MVGQSNSEFAKTRGYSKTTPSNLGQQVLSDSSTNVNSMINRRASLFYCYCLEASHHMVLSGSNPNVNSMINKRVSLFYLCPLEASHHVVCPCTLYSACVVCPGTRELVGQHPPPISMSGSENGDCQP